MPLDHCNRAGYLSHLGILLGKKYAQTAMVEILEEAISAAKQAVDLTLPDDPNKPGRLNNLGNRLEARYERLGAMEDLQTAIQVSREAVKSTRDSHLNLPTWLSNLANKLEVRFVRMGEMRDLDESIALADKAVSLSTENDPDHAVWLNNLGNKLLRRYQCIGQTSDLNRAIVKATKAAGLRLESTPERVSVLNNLGVLLDHRYARTGELLDLQAAIEISRKNVDLSINSQHLWANCLTNLSTKLEKLYRRTSAMEDLEESIVVGRKAVKHIPDDHPSKAIYLNNLGNKLRVRYDATKNLEDLDDGIQVLRQSVELTQSGHPDLPARLSNLATKLHKRCSVANKIGDLEEAIVIARRAVLLTSKDHPARAGRLDNLGSMLETRYNLKKEICDLVEAAKVLREAWNCLVAVPFTRIQANSRCMKVLVRLGQFDDAVQLGKDVLRLLPDVNTGLIDRGDQQFVVSIFSGIANDLCALQLQSDQVEDALKCLEEGRAIILGQLLDRRSDTSVLSRDHPEIGHRYESLLYRIGTLSLDSRTSSTWEETRTLRDHLTSQLHACIENIRALPGYDRFLTRHTIAEMQECASRGVLVVVNASFHRCDALLVEQQGLRHVALPEASSRTIQENVAKFGINSVEMLEWLWKCIASPILGALGLTSPPSNQDWPHIWWIPTGVFSRLPLHAAGLYHSGSKETVLDRVISSYAFSVKAIIYSRSAPSPDLKLSNTNQAIMVAMPNTEDAPNLPWAAKEVETVRGICESMNVHSKEPGQLNEDVMSCLRICQIFHFAGHGHTSAEDPLKSFLLLEDWKTKPLTVATLLGLDLKKSSRAFFAYLSACGTVQIRSEQLFDESLHLISAFQLAGFRHVIGTLWEVNDEACVHVARVVYEVIRDKGLTDDAISTGLHIAIRELRNMSMKLLTATSEKQTDKKLNPDKMASINQHDGNMGVTGFERDVILCQTGLDYLNWIPYVHFGV